MRVVCSSISVIERLVISGSGLGRSASVSRKPLSTVSGVRSSCDTLATKSRRVVSSRSQRVTSRDSSSLSLSP